MKKQKIETKSNEWLKVDYSECLFDLRMKVLNVKCAFLGCEENFKDLTLLN